MRDSINRFVAFVARVILSLRYRVVVRGAEKLDQLENKPTLVLPNHPAYIDPMIVMSQLGGRLPMRPLVFTDTYRMRFLGPLMRFVRAVEVPDLSNRSKQAKEKTEQMVQSVIDDLRGNQTFLIYPSGRLQRGGAEVVGGASAVADIVSKVGEVQIVLIRTSGLWGSMFGFAQTGTLPELDKCVLKGFRILVRNVLFFCSATKYNS